MPGPAVTRTRGGAESGERRERRGDTRHSSAVRVCRRANETLKIALPRASLQPYFLFQDREISSYEVPPLEVTPGRKSLVHDVFGSAAGARCRAVLVLQILSTRHEPRPRRAHGRAHRQPARPGPAEPQRQPLRARPAAQPSAKVSEVWPVPRSARGGSACAHARPAAPLRGAPAGRSAPRPPAPRCRGRLRQADAHRSRVRGGNKSQERSRGAAETPVAPGGAGKGGGGGGGGSGAAERGAPPAPGPGLAAARTGLPRAAAGGLT